MKVPLVLVFSASALFCISLVRAAPHLEPRQSISTLSATQVTTFKPYMFYAASAYCKPANTLAWNCGGKIVLLREIAFQDGLIILWKANCNANPSFRPVASGGDGGITQFWYVGYDTTLRVGRFYLYPVNATR
jgi:hypothetical protein